MSTEQFAVIDRDGFFRDATRVYSTHATKRAAVRAASKHRVSIPGNVPEQSSAMVIRSNGGGLRKGAVIYRDTIRNLYPVMW